MDRDLAGLQVAGAAHKRAPHARLAMERVSSFVESHPSVKLLALAFLILIGVVLVADAFGHHVPKGYIYFSMAFSLGVEMLNLRYRSRQAKRRRRAA